jgi:hypothetical protein
MTQNPFTFSDVSLVLAIVSIILAITSELGSVSYGRTNLLINRKRLRNLAVATGMLFLLTVAIRLYALVAS